MQFIGRLCKSSFRRSCKILVLLLEKLFFPSLRRLCLYVSFVFIEEKYFRSHLNLSSAHFPDELTTIWDRKKRFSFKEISFQRSELRRNIKKNHIRILTFIWISGVEKDLHISIARSLVCDFGTGLEGHLYGSPQLVSKQLNMIGDLLELISEQRPRTLADSDEESITFMDLPREILSIILR